MPTFTDVELRKTLQPTRQGGLSRQQINIMYFIHQISLDLKNEIERLEKKCEKNFVTITNHLNYEYLRDLYHEIDTEVRDWFSIEAPIFFDESGYAQGDATDEEVIALSEEHPDLVSIDGDEFSFYGLDQEWAKRYKAAYQQEIENTETAIDAEIESNQEEA